MTYPEGGSSYDIFVIDLTIASDDSVTVSTAVNATNSPDDEELHPSWSPDDLQIVCWSANYGKRTTTGLFTVHVATGTRELLLAAARRSTIGLPEWKRSTP